MGFSIDQNIRKGLKIMFNSFKKRYNLVKELEVRALVLEETIQKNKKLREQENMILDSINKNKAYFEDYYAGTYLTKLQQFTDEQLKMFARNGLRGAVLYIRQLGAEILKEEISLSQRILGIMLHDLSDSVHNLPMTLEDDHFERSSLEFEALLILQFLHSYDDYLNIQKERLCTPFISFKNSFPPDFLIDEVTFIKNQKL